MSRAIRNDSQNESFLGSSQPHRYPALGPPPSPGKGSFHEHPTPMLAAEQSGASYSMENLNLGRSSSATLGPSRSFSNPDAGWAENRPSLGAGGFGAAMDADQRKKSRRKFFILAAVVLAILAVAGVVIGIVIPRLNKNDSRSSSSSASTTTLNSDVFKFDKDSRLHQSFYGMCYTPFDSQYQFGCGANLSSVIEDVQLLSQLTTRIRLYGADCNVSALVLQAIQDTKTNLTVYLAIYLNSDDPGDAAWTRQLNNITFALDSYGFDNIGGITVGNEYLLNGGSEANLLSYVQKFRVYATEKGWTVPVGSADAGSVFSANVATGIDYFMANVHAYFGGILVEDGSSWTWEYFENTDNSIAKAASNAPKAYIAEVGWPSGANATNQLMYKDDNGQVTGAVAGLANLQTFIDGYVCEANTNGTGYFWFEMYDEEWKDAMYGGVEAYWGLFDKTKKLKDLNLPDCTHS